MSLPFPPRLLLFSVLAFTAENVIGAGTAAADLIRLHSGGEVRGEVRDEPPSSEKRKGDREAEKESHSLTVITLSGAEMVLAQPDVEFVEQRTAIFEEYVTRARVVEDTVEGHWDLAEWCRSQRLLDEQREQLERVVELEPDHAEARGILRHVNRNGVWMSREEMMRQRGYVQHRGRWITTQEMELLNKTSAEREAELAWFPKIRTWLAWATSTSPQRQKDGVQNLKDIQDPDAISALDRFLGSHESRQVRLLMVEILSGISDQRIVVPLLEFFLYDGDPVVRRGAIDLLGPAYLDTALPHLVKALDDDSNLTVNRAAEALGFLGDERAVPRLIESLITSHKYKVAVPQGNQMSFGTGADGRPTMGGSSLIPPGIEMMARAGQLPYGAIVNPPNVPGAMKTVTVRVTVKNTDVLGALQKLTGQDFGYDERAWLQWWTVKKG
ncbi:MAG: HEAT repeat domain-containing protein [Planctomycetaceae bacterium]|nr:HEAT repeat domain-containing protein [Planctomycetaceae bacterium]